MNGVDLGLISIVGAAPSPSAPPTQAETIADAVKKVTPSIVLLGIVTGATIAIGSALGQGLVALVRKK